MLNTYLYVLLYFTQSWPKNISIYATPEEDAPEVQWSMAVEQHWWNSNWRKWIVCQPSEQFYNSEELFNICHVGIFMFIRRSCTYLARSFDTIRYLKGVLQNITNYWYRGVLEEMLGLDAGNLVLLSGSGHLSFVRFFTTTDTAQELDLAVKGLCVHEPLAQKDIHLKVLLNLCDSHPFGTCHHLSLGKITIHLG